VLELPTSRAMLATARLLSSLSSTSKPRAPCSRLWRSSAARYSRHSVSSCSKDVVGGPSRYITSIRHAKFRRRDRRPWLPSAAQAAANDDTAGPDVDGRIEYPPPQTASGSSRPFFHNTRSLPTGRRRTDRQNDDETTCNNRPLMLHVRRRLTVNTGYRYGPKNLAQLLYAVTSSNINRFLKFFHCQKFTIIPSLKLPPHLKCVATLPCEISLSGTKCRSISLITPLVSGVAGLNASSSSNVGTMNI